MKRSLRELELLTPVISLIDSRKIVGGYIDDEGPDYFPLDQGNYLYWETEASLPNDGFETPDLPPIIDGDIGLDNDVEFIDPGIDSYEPGNDCNEISGEGDEEGPYLANDIYGDYDTQNNQDDERDDREFDQYDNDDHSEPEQGDPSNITFNNVPPAVQTIIEQTMSALPAKLQGISVTIEIGPTKDNAPAQYSNGVITFSNASNISSSLLFHEMVHAFQDDKFEEDGIDMNKTSRSAIEYQSAVLQNLFDAVTLDGGFSPACFSNEYMLFMIESFSGANYSFENFNYEYFIKHVNDFYSEFVNQHAGESSGYGDNYNPDYDFDWAEWLKDLFNLEK